MKLKEKHYFSIDGNYGSADGLVVVDTSAWTAEEWSIIEETPDSDRAGVAKQLTVDTETGK